MITSTFEASPDTRPFWQRIFPISWFRRSGIHDWQFHPTVFGHKYRVLDGETVRTTLIMRRKLMGGEWQYRVTTYSERFEWFDRLQY